MKFSEDEDPVIRYCAAASLHEAFKIIDDDEDTTKLRVCFINILLDGNKDMLHMVNKNLVIFITKYGNKHYLENFKGRTPYLEPSSNENSKDNTPKSNKSKSSKAKQTNNTDFSTALIENSKKGLTKKNTHLGIAFDNFDQEELSPKLPPIYVTPEHEIEVLYSDLLQRLMVFINNIRSYTGLWREHAKLINNLVETVHLFYMPEVHSYLVPMLVDFVYKGNKDIKDAACKCLARILKY